MGISKNNKTLAINTLVLYGRMLFCMALSFFTTRIALQALGVVNFGLVNAIGGVVSMFVFMSIPLSTACSRFFSFDIGREDYIQLEKTFSMIMLLYVLAALILTGLIETIGLWYMRNKLSVPFERYNAAIVFFHLSVATLIIHWFSIPYSAMIISHEKMGIFAKLSIFEAISKFLAATLVLLVKDMDGLMLYGAALFVGTLAFTSLNAVCAFMSCKGCRFRWHFERSKFKELCAFNGWQLFGSLGWTSSEVFVNLLLNSFFGPVVNAARSISSQVMGGVFGFAQNFLTAVRPQIVKMWAAGDKVGYYNLLKRSSKFSCFLVVIFGIPLFLELETVLHVWLTVIPDYTVIFIRITLMTALINAFSLPIVYAAQAVGKIALFELIGSGVRILVWPISWATLKFGCGPVSVFYIALAIALASLMLRFAILVKESGIPAPDFIKDVIIRMGLIIILVSSITVLPTVVMLPGLLRFFVVVGVGAILTCSAFIFLGLNGAERRAVLSIIETRVRAFVIWRRNG